jgi:peptidoglycan/xylan/chitin deacetylase (PgdA/CDA1 family)
VVSRGVSGVSTYKEFTAVLSPHQRMRAWGRDAAVCALSLTRSVPQASWIRFPYYHHVFDDQRAGFEAQLRYMTSIGSMISLDDAVALMEADTPIDGRYFCITFDDGYKNCVTNALPILAEHQVPAAFFVATAFVGAVREQRDPALVGTIEAYDRFVTDFMTWDDCRQLVGAGMTLGSHSATHPRLAHLSASDVEHELRHSKEVIEQELGTDCRHFSCPKGQPGTDFRPDRDPGIARRIGYRSFSTTTRGTVRDRPNPMLIPRDHVIASWSVRQLRYFFSR